jgi:beta-glucosidase
MANSEMNRRDFIGTAVLVAGGAMSLGAEAASNRRFSDNFLWGASTAAHQIEGNNVASDYWVWENVKPTFFRERSGDACDSYHRYAEDIQLLKSFGLGAYRFSIEWARIEPSKGEFSRAELDYYKRVVAKCRELGIKPALTFHHNTSPIWFTAAGGWSNPDSPKLFADYCAYAARELAADIDAAFTINEPNVNAIVAWMPIDENQHALMLQALAAVNRAAAKAVGSEVFQPLLFAPSQVVTPNLIAAHHQGFSAIKAARSGLPVGVALSVFDYEPAGPASKASEAQKETLGDWIKAAKTSGDFVGVQNYGRVRVDASGPVKLSGTSAYPYEPYAPSLGKTVKFIHEATGKPIVVSENGIDTADDNLRIRYIDEALQGLHDAIVSGVPVLGYFHWSLLDNFEWIQGFTPRYGLTSVDRKTFARTPKPSAYHLGALAKRNSI